MPAGRLHPWRYAAVILLFTWSLTTHGKFSVSGDEPHYLIITHSLTTDGDLDLENNYQKDDGAAFGHPGLEQGMHAIRAPDGRTLSTHDVGLGVILVPVYAVARAVATRTSEALLARFRLSRGLFVYALIGLALMALTTSGMVMLIGRLDGPPRQVALLVTLAAISPPIVSHTFLVFPDVLGLFVTCAVVASGLSPDRPGDEPRLVLLALLAGALVWTHHKYLVYTPGLVFVLCWYRWAWLTMRPRGWLVAAAAAYLLPQLALYAWTWMVWGTIGGPLTTAEMPFSWAMFRSGAPGLWIDRQSGLMAYAPIYWLVPAAAALTWRRSWPGLVPAVLLYLPAAAFVIGWWAGFAPAARYLVPAIPFMLVAMAAALRHRPFRIAAIGLSVAQLAIDLVAWQRPRFLWPAEDGNRLLQALGPLGRGYEAALPPLQQAGPTAHTAWVFLAWAIASALLVVAVRRTEGPTLRPSAN